MNQLNKILLCFLAGIMCVVTLLLVNEYSFFKTQARLLQDLQQEYRNYLVAVKKILNSAHYKNNFSEINEKKKESCEITSLDECDQEDDASDDEAFLLLNRDPSYLKESMISHLRQENMEFLLAQIDVDDLIAYTDQLLEAIKEPEKKPKARTIKTKVLRKKSTAPLKTKSFSSKVKRGTPGILLSWPIQKNKFWLSSFFGPRKKPNGHWGYHHGIDMAALRGTPVKAAAGGVVVEATRSKGYGKTIVVSHTKKYKTRYAHLDKILVRVGQKINRGQLIGKVGDTGFVRKTGKDASHLHFEVYVYGKKTNPMYFLA